MNRFALIHAKQIVFSPSAALSFCFFSFSASLSVLLLVRWCLPVLGKFSERWVLVRLHFGLSALWLLPEAHRSPLFECRTWPLLLGSLIDPKKVPVPLLAHLIPGINTIDDLEYI